jgi:TAT-translocated FGD2 family F420-dependent dehydrogenase
MASIGYVLSDEQFSPVDLVEWGVAAEQAGFDMVWCSDHFHPWQDNQGHSGMAWMTLAALGQRQSRIAMGTGVTCPTYRYNPAIVAQGFATLATLYPGRIFLGVGSGEAVNELPTTGQWHDYAGRSRRLVEAVMLIRKLWSGNWVDFRGDYYQVQDAKLYDPPAQPVPIYIAASGTESMRLAGWHGDGLVTGAETLEKQEPMDAFRQGAEEAGKNPDQMPIVVETWAFVGKQKAAEKAAEKWRFVPKAFDKFVDNPDPRIIQKQAQEKVSIEEAMNGWAIGEAADMHIEALQKVIDNGATHIFVHSPQEDQGRMIDFYGERVLPKLEHSLMEPSHTVQEIAHAH